MKESCPIVKERILEVWVQSGPDYYLVGNLRVLKIIVMRIIH